MRPFAAHRGAAPTHGLVTCSGALGARKLCVVLAQRFERLDGSWSSLIRSAARASLRIALVGSLVPVLAAGCLGDSNAVPDSADWVCNEDTACSCEALKSDVEVVSARPSVVACATYDCCLLTERETEYSFASCECSNTATSCEAEAASRRNVSVVERCPPGSALPPCAAAGENCRPEYLSQNELTGCCAGLLCRANAAGVPTCQPGSPEELAQAAACDRVARSNSLNELEVLTPSIRTSVGELSVGDVRFAFPGAGPGGCLNDLRITIGGLGCSFEFEVALSGGSLAPANFIASIADCPGFVGEANQNYLSPGLSPGDPLPFSFSFEGISCDAHLIFESYCVAGSFDFHLGGTLRGVTFEDQHFVVRGVMCNADPSGACPER
jgi:hypothetical protein